MPTYKVEEVDETPIGLQLIFYAIIFTILLPIGIIYLIYKIIKYFYNKKKEREYAEICAQEQLIKQQKQEEKERRQLQAEASDRLLKLKALYDNGIISKSEYETRRQEEIRYL